MTRIVPKSLIAFAAVAATASLAACASGSRSQTATTVQPTPEGAIQWNTPREAANGSTNEPATGNTTASGAPQPGDTIRWKDETPPNASAPSTSAPTGSAPGGSATGPTVTPVPNAPPSKPAPNASAAPSATPAPSTQAPAQPGPPIAWTGGLDGNVLQVEIIDRYGHYRVDRVSLVSPQGQEYVAPELTYLGPRYSGGSGGGGVSNVGIGVGGWGGSSSGTSVGLGLGFPLGGSSPPRDVDANAPRTVARIPLPDPQGYRYNPMGWTVRVRLLDSAGAASIAQFPAPLPPRP